VLGGAILLAGSWVVVAAQATVPHWEARLFSAVNDMSNVWWVLVWGPMQLGSFLGSLVVVGLTGVISRDRRLTLAALVGSQAAYWTALAVKNLVSRGRPTAFFTEVHLHDQATGFGYVSGHAAVAFALAAVLAPSLPRAWRAVVIALAVTVAFGRVYAGVHLPLDVVGGAGLGVLCGTLARWAFGLGGEGLPVALVGDEPPP
jgi:undecaprenyl-diphosphatase